MQACVMVKPNDMELTQEIGGFMTVGRAAEVLDISEAAVHKAIERGRIRAIWIDRRTRMLASRSVGAYQRRRERYKAVREEEAES